MYQALTEQKAIEYCKDIGIFDSSASLFVNEIGDGNLNLVFRLWDESSGKSVIVKQALPYARIVGESMPLTLDRARIELEALSIEGELCYERVPDVYHFNSDLALTVMQDLSTHTVLRKGLIKGIRYPKFAIHIGDFLANTLFYTSDFSHRYFSKKQLFARFINPELCKITEDLVFTEPWYDASNNQYDASLHGTVEEMRKDRRLVQAAIQLKYRFMTGTEALVHGDLHTGSIMVTETDTKVIDPEFAFVGPIGFDIGSLFANLLFSYASHTVQADRPGYPQWLLITIVNVWKRFMAKYGDLYIEEAVFNFPNFPGLEEPFIRTLLSDTAGFCGCELIRRVVGLAHVEDLESIEDPLKRREAFELVLRFARPLILNRNEVKRIEDLIAIVQACTDLVSVERGFYTS